MGAYADRYSRHKPECYGDADYYDSADPDCQVCPYRGTCRTTVRRKEREARETHQYRRAASPDKRRVLASGPDPSELVERPDEENIGFFGALVVNGMLSGVRAGLVEAVFAVDQIPRYAYPDPFSERSVRRRKLPQGHDEDD